MLHPVLWGPEVWGTVCFPHHNSSCPGRLPAAFPGVPRQEGVVIRCDWCHRAGPEGLDRLPQASAPRRMCPHPRWPFQRLDVRSRGTCLSSPSQVLTGRSRTGVLDWCLPEKREFGAEETDLLPYTRQGIRSPQSASPWALEQLSLLTLSS